VAVGVGSPLETQELDIVTAGQKIERPLLEVALDADGQKRTFRPALGTVDPEGVPGGSQVVDFDGHGRRAALDPVLADGQLPEFVAEVALGRAVDVLEEALRKKALDFIGQGPAREPGEE
jgi:hypothetical protein